MNITFDNARELYNYLVLSVQSCFILDLWAYYSCSGNITSLGIYRCYWQSNWTSWKKSLYSKINNSILLMDFHLYQHQEGRRSGYNWCLLSYLQFLSRILPCQLSAQILLWLFISGFLLTHILLYYIDLPWQQKHPSTRPHLILTQFKVRAPWDM